MIGSHWFDIFVKKTETSEESGLFFYVFDVFCGITLKGRGLKSRSTHERVADSKIITSMYYELVFVLNFNGEI